MTYRNEDPLVRGAEAYYVLFCLVVWVPSFLWYLAQDAGRVLFAFLLAKAKRLRGQTS